MKYSKYIERKVVYPNGARNVDVREDNVAMVEFLRGKVNEWDLGYACEDDSEVYKDRDTKESIVRHEGVEGVVYINNQATIDRIKVRMQRRLLEYGLSYAQANAVIDDMVKELAML